MKSRLCALAHYLPELEVGNEELSRFRPEWTPTEIREKTWIEVRRIAPPEVCSSDLAFEAAKRLFDSGLAVPGEIDLLVLCTQSPDYFLPTTACILQSRLDLPTHAAAFDFNLGCSGYVYGLGLVRGMLETGQARCALLIMAETYSKFLRDDDLSVRTIFGDAASATLLRAEPDEQCPNGYPYAFAYGTDGSGAENLIVKAGGMRYRCLDQMPGDPKVPDPLHLYMNGPAIFAFTLSAVPKLVREVLDAAEIQPENVDLYVFHQANGFMLAHLRKKLRIPEEKFAVCLRDCGNTVSATVPITLEMCVKNGTLRPGMKVMLVGFGVGYSWGGCLIDWPQGVLVA